MAKIGHQGNCQRHQGHTGILEGQQGKTLDNLLMVQVVICIDHELKRDMKSEPKIVAQCRHYSMREYMKNLSLKLCIQIKGSVYLS